MGGVPDEAGAALEEAPRRRYPGGRAEADTHVLPLARGSQVDEGRSPRRGEGRRKTEAREGAAPRRRRSAPVSRACAARSRGGRRGRNRGGGSAGAGRSSFGDPRSDGERHRRSGDRAGDSGGEDGRRDPPAGASGDPPATAGELG